MNKVFEKKVDVPVIPRFSEEIKLSIICRKRVF